MSKNSKKSDQVPHVCPGPVSQDFATFSGSPFINAKEIFWHLEGNITEDFEEVKVVEAFRSAFSILQPYFHPIKFISTSDISKANLIIHFAVNGDNDLPRQFPGHVLAYAFSPSNNVSNLWFNDERNWGDMHVSKTDTYNLISVTVHEVLHSLGFMHSNPVEWPGDILNPTYQPFGKVEFSEDTLNAIQFLYGDLKKEIKKEREEEKKTQTPSEDPRAAKNGGCRLVSIGVILIITSIWYACTSILL